MFDDAKLICFYYPANFIRNNLFIICCNYWLNQASGNIQQHHQTIQNMIIPLYIFISLPWIQIHSHEKFLPDAPSDQRSLEKHHLLSGVQCSYCPLFSLLHCHGYSFSACAFWDGKPGNRPCFIWTQPEITATQSELFYFGNAAKLWNRQNTDIRLLLGGYSFLVQKYFYLFVHLFYGSGAQWNCWRFAQQNVPKNSASSYVVFYQWT